MRKYLVLGLWMTLCPLLAHAADSFVVGDIRIEGLQRISAGSVFAAMPINVGDTLDEERQRRMIRALFRSGNFDDIRLFRDGNILVVNVQERPSISEIQIEGNKAIKSEALLDGLGKAGLAEGQVFKRSTLEGMRMELTRQYVSQGRYDANIQTEVVAQPRNRVAININVDEGSTAAIKSINILGNHAFSDETLRNEFELKSTGRWSWLTGNDKYSREKLTGDLEKLSSYYLDRGYIEFEMDSTQVSITPDRKAVYITAGVTEGDVYTVGAVELSGDIILPEEELRRFILVEPGQTFSQALVTRTEELLGQRLGDEGYNFARINGIPQVDEAERTVSLRFFVDPGMRTYVRRIAFSGNHRTADEVLRREMRQMESAPASRAKIEQSRVRLDRLGYFKQADVDTREVAGSDDLIDLLYSVEEQASGSIGASIGYAQDSGMLLGANIQQNNFMGSGKQVGIGVSRSRYMTSARFSYTNPYFTEDGVSRGFSIFYRKANLDKINVASYTTNTLGASLNFGYPLSETQALGFAFGYANTEIETGFAAVKEIVGSPRIRPELNQFFHDRYDPATGEYLGPEQLQAFDPSRDASILRNDLYRPGFVDLYGDRYDVYTATISWNQSTLNRGQLATRGYSQSVSLEVAVPGSDLEYYKLLYNGQIFVPLTDKWTLRFRTELGYADGYGDLDHLPFFENFFSGGFGSVRGFKSNTLGPRSTPADIYSIRRAVTSLNSDNQPDGYAAYGGYGYVVGRDGKLQVQNIGGKPDPFGGNVLVEGSVELLFPLPFVKDQRSLRSAFFVDAGNVFNTRCGSSQLNCNDVDLGELRYSVGFGITWITGFGPLTFSLAKPLNDGRYDDTEVFQFSLGHGF